MKAVRSGFRASRAPRETTSANRSGDHSRQPRRKSLRACVRKIPRPTRLRWGAGSFGFEILVQPEGTSDLAGADGFFEALEAVGHMIARRQRMSEMKYDGVSMDKFAAPAKMVEARAQVGIFADAPARILLVEAVDRDQVVAPDRQVAANDPA